jgi:hypothetical protein
LRNPQDALPIGAVLPDIQAAAAEAPTLVIVAPPDAMEKRNKKISKNKIKKKELRETKKRIK